MLSLLRNHLNIRSCKKCRCLLISVQAQAQQTCSESSLSVETLVYPEFGDPPKVVQKETQNITGVKDEQIIVRMLASSVNPADINTIQGVYAIKPESFPAIGGNEGVGIVERVGAGPNPFNVQKDDWVIPAKNNMGTWRTHMVGWNQDFIPVPKKMDVVSACTIAVNPPTAYRMLKDFEFLHPGDLIVQNGGNSAVGQNVIQLCRVLGYNSISVVRNRENIDELKTYLKSLGNEHTNVMTEEEFKQNITTIKARLALNCVGGKSAADLLRVLEPGRTMVTYGGMSRQPLAVPASSLIFHDVRLKGFWITRWNQTHNIESRGQMIKLLAELFTKGELKPPDTELVPLANYKEALENSMKGFTGKKFILTF